MFGAVQPSRRHASQPGGVKGVLDERLPHTESQALHAIIVARPRSHVCPVDQVGASLTLTIRWLPYGPSLAVGETARIALSCRWTPSGVRTTDRPSEGDTSGPTVTASDAPTADVSANESTSNRSIARLIASPLSGLPHHSDFPDSARKGVSLTGGRLGGSPRSARTPRHRPAETASRRSRVPGACSGRTPCD